MVSHFDQERADKLTNRSQPNPSVPWLDGFIKVQDPNFRESDAVNSRGAADGDLLALVGQPLGVSGLKR